MYTANTMASAIEALGMTLPDSSAAQRRIARQGGRFAAGRRRRRELLAGLTRATS